MAVQVGIIILSIVMILIVTGISFYILFLQWREAGPIHAIIGFFFSPYMYIWGWINARKLQIIDIMVFLTVVTIIFVGFISLSIQSLISQFSSAPSDDFSYTTTNDDGFTTTTYNDGDSIIISGSSNAFGSDNATPMGEISIGGSITDNIEKMSEVHEYTFNGSAGQTVTIYCNETGSDSMDPRIYLMGPDGTWLTSDDDSGDEKNALISNFTLPVDGQYAIQVDGWRTGEYELFLN